MDERYYIKDSEYREGFNMCQYFIKRISELTEGQLEEIYGYRSLKVIFEDEKIEDVIKKYQDWLHDFHVNSIVVPANITSDYIQQKNWEDIEDNVCKDRNIDFTIDIEDVAECLRILRNKN